MDPVQQGCDRTWRFGIREIRLFFVSASKPTLPWARPVRHVAAGLAVYAGVCGAARLDPSDRNPVPAETEVLPTGSVR
jgi:hypothetical protein